MSQVQCLSDDGRWQRQAALPFLTPCPRQLVRWAAACCRCRSCLPGWRVWSASSTPGHAPARRVTVLTSWIGPMHRTQEPLHVPSDRSCSALVARDIGSTPQLGPFQCVCTSDVRAVSRGGAMKAGCMTSSEYPSFRLFLNLVRSVRCRNAGSACSSNCSMPRRRYLALSSCIQVEHPGHNRPPNPTFRRRNAGFCVSISHKSHRLQK